MWNSRTWTVQRTLEGHGWVGAITFLAGENTLASGSGAIRFWDTRSGKLKHAFSCMELGCTTCILRFPTTVVYLQVGIGRILSFWMSERVKHHIRLTLGIGRITSLAFSPRRRITCKWKYARGNPFVGYAHRRSAAHIGTYH